MPIVFFITHPDVQIDRNVPVPEWPLNERGRARMRAMATHRWVGGVRSVFVSSERKARDGAQLLVEGLGLPGYSVVGSLGEHDRSATGYLPKQEFEAAADAFFAGPQISVRGWERAADAQTRIIHAIEQAVSQASDTGDVAIVGHGGTGTLLYCHLAGLPISRRYEQPPTNGGNWFAFDWASRKLLHRGWRSIDTPTSDETGGVVIETVRLRIRSLHDNDLAHLVALIGNWEVARWVSSVPHPYTEADGRNWIALVQQDHATGRPRRFAVALKETDRLIGGAGLDGSAGNGSEEPSLGYWVGQPYWGNGYGREAVAAVIDYGFRTPWP